MIESKGAYIFQANSQLFKKRLTKVSRIMISRATEILRIEIGHQILHWTSVNTLAGTEEVELNKGNICLKKQLDN